MPLTLPDDVEINNKLMIELVKKRPLLYDRHCPGYCSLEQKKHAWREVGSQLFPEHWPNWDNATRHSAVTGMQQRWGNLRTCFSRCWKKYNSKKLKGNQDDYVSYRNFERLQFLTKHMNLQYNAKTDKMENVTVDSIDTNSEGDNPDDQTEEYEEQSLEDSFQEEEYLVTEEPKKKKIKKEIEIDSFEPDPLNSTSSKRAVSGLNVVPDIVEAGTDQDINFVMSLVPMFRGLPLSKKLQVQIDILNLFRKITDN